MTETACPRSLARPHAIARAAHARMHIVGLLLFGSIVAVPVRLAAENRTDIRRETIHIPGPSQGLKLGLRRAVMSDSAAGAARRAAVLILHGANLPTSANADFPLGGRSMMTALAETGLDVWALDFYGYGESDRYPEMAEPADRHPPLGPAEECADQVEAVAKYLQREHGVDRMMLIGDSRGSLAAGIFATRHPQSVSRLVLFGPITPHSGAASASSTLPAYDFVVPKDLWARFAAWAQAAGEPNVLDPKAYEALAERYLRSDPTSANRTPASVKVPNGKAADMAAVAAGRFPYEPGRIQAPTLIVMGEWDEVTTFAGARWLLESLRQAPQRRLTMIGHGSHTVQYETERVQLYRVVADFLNERG